MSDKPITLFDVKQAMRDNRFRASLPADLKEDTNKYLQNPGCACNMPIYRNVLKLGKAQLESYFPGRTVVDIEAEDKAMKNSYFTVIDCNVKDLQEKLNKLKLPRHIQMTTSRYEDKIVVIIRELEIP